MIVLDTHAWIWSVSDPGLLSARAREAMASAKRLAVPAISCWELAMLVAKGRLGLDRAPHAWIRQALAGDRLVLVELSPEIATVAASLGDGFPGDPADRLIVASALDLKAPLVTKDKRLRGWRGVRTLW